MPASDPTQAAELRERLGVDFTATQGRVWETDDFLYLPVVVNFSSAGTIEREAIMFAIGRDYPEVPPGWVTGWGVEQGFRVLGGVAY